MTVSKTVGPFGVPRVQIPPPPRSERHPVGCLSSYRVSGIRYRDHPTARDRAAPGRRGRHGRGRHTVIRIPDTRYATVAAQGAATVATVRPIKIIETERDDFDGPIAELCGQKAVLALLVGQIDLEHPPAHHAGLSRDAVYGAGDLQAVDRVHPLKMLGYGAGLVRLQWSDEVPLDIQALQLRLFGQRLLHVVFTEGALPQRVQIADSLGRMLLADRQQHDFVGLTARRFAGCGDPCTNIVKIFF